MDSGLTGKQFKPPPPLSFLSTPVRMHSWLTYVTFCLSLRLSISDWTIIATGKKSLDQRWGPHNGGNLPKVRSRYCPHEKLHWPSKVEISILNGLILNCNSGVKSISHVTGRCALSNVKLHFYFFIRPPTQCIR